MQKLFLRSSDPRAFLKELSLIVSAGIPLSKALDITKKHPDFISISDQVNTGRSFAEALDRKHFPSAVINIITVGEKSGNISGALARACQYMAKKDTMRSKLISALIYPAFILFLCIASLFILVSLLLPTFSGIFNGLGVKLPFLSSVILASSGFMPAIAVIFSLIIYYLIRYIASDRGFNFPVAGRFRQKLVAASFLRSMSGSLSAGLNIIDSMQLSKSVLGSKLFEDRLSAALNMVIEGSTLSFSLGSTDLFSDTDISLISAGEQASSLDRVFDQLAQYYEEEIENNVKIFSSLVEPISTLATGVVVGVIVFAMFMPIIKLISVLGS